MEGEEKFEELVGMPIPQTNPQKRLARTVLRTLIMQAKARANHASSLVDQFVRTFERDNVVVGEAGNLSKKLADLEDLASRAQLTLRTLQEYDGGLERELGIEPAS